MPKRKRIVAVIGDSRCLKPVLDIAEEVGRLVALKGAVLMCGGYGGVMEAAARGAKKAGGQTIGILSGKDASGMNAWIDIPIVTGMRDARNIIIARTADGVVAVGGGFGTLSEIAFSLMLDKKIVGIGSWKLSHHDSSRRFYFPLLQDAKTAVQHLFRRIR